MKRNVRIAKELVKLAKSLVATNDDNQNRLDEAEKAGKKYIIIQDGTDKKVQACKDINTFVGTIRRGTIGGIVESETNLSQKDSCWIGPGVRVFENACVFGDAQVYGPTYIYKNALVYGHAFIQPKEGNVIIDDNAQVYDNVEITGHCTIHENAQVYENAEINGNGVNIHGNALIYNDAIIGDGVEVFGEAEIFDDAEISNHAIISGNAVICGDAKVNFNVSKGKINK